MTRERCRVDFRPKLRYKRVSLAPNSEGNSVRRSPRPGSRVHSARETQLVHLLEVVCRRDDLPLSFDLANSTQQELPKPKDLLDGAKGRFDRALPFAVDLPPATCPQAMSRCFNDGGVRIKCCRFLKAQQTAGVSLATMRNIGYHFGLGAQGQIRCAKIARVGQNFSDGSKLCIELAQSCDCWSEQRLVRRALAHIAVDEQA